jgi:hypothetical protein
MENCCIWFVIYLNYKMRVLILSTLLQHYRLRWSRGSVLAFGTQVRGFKPDRSRRIFKHAFLRRGSKAVCPMSQILDL